ncbi:PTS sugar transporter subunit IIA [Candidatus Protochlamydia phocaeensis]|uniref:PTS sugar transporter subunit IIA n=1 Tax=Candidatus Protochlamydia phocaeensis TaxID=1414722 RepID=UPI000838A498|nr:PTS sugar transporter subunit IIA [Candidatus Protochlamydia phocaeensis]
MDLKIKDVADLLNVSETTIRRWITDGKIPTYRINQHYYFSRTEIESWVMAHKLDKSYGASPFTQKKDIEISVPIKKMPASGGSKQFSLFRAIHKGEVLHHISGQTKEDIIRTTMKKVAKHLHVDADVMTDLLLDRENMMPTALNNGIAVPHTRDSLLDAHHDVVIPVFLKEPLEYGALDGKPVHTLFFLFACEDKRHLHLLAKIAHLSSQPAALELFQTKPEKEKLLHFIKEWEGSIAKAHA